MAVIAITVYHADVGSLFVFFTFLLFYIQLPGGFLLRILKFNSGHVSPNLLVSFFSGWALLVALYFISDLLETSILLYAIGPICSLAYISLLFIKRFDYIAVRRFRFSDLPLSLYIFVLLLFAYIMLETQFLYMSPEHCSNIAPSIDKTYQMGLISVLSHDYPLADPWVYGINVNYHIFSQILFSVPMTLFGLSADFLVMSCHPYMTSFVLSLSLYSMFKYFCKRKDLAGVYTLSILLSQMFVARNATTSYLFRILFVNDNYGGYAIACLIACAIVLDTFVREYNADECNPYTLAFLLTSLTMLLTGIKAPVGLVFVGGLIGTALLSLIMRANTLKLLSLAAAVPVIGFYIVYSLVLGSTGTEGVGGKSPFKFGNILGICFWKSDLIEFLKGIGVPSFIRLLMILLVFALFFFSAYLLPFAIGYLHELVLVITRKKAFEFSKVSIYAASVVGFVMMMFLKYTGHSQIYFGTVLVAFAPLIAFWFFEDAKEKAHGLFGLLYKLSIYSFFVILLVSSLSLMQDIREMIPSAIRRTDAEIKYDAYGSLSSDEYEAMIWIKDNTEEDALIATQMYASTDLDDYDVSNRWLNTHFLYAAYSDRHYYLEGSGFTLEDSQTPIRVEMIENNNRLFDENNPSRGDDAEALGVDYVVVTKKIYPEVNLSCDDYSVVFSNKDIEIYQVIP